LKVEGSHVDIAHAQFTCKHMLPCSCIGFEVLTESVSNVWSWGTFYHFSWGLKEHCVSTKLG